MADKTPVRVVFNASNVATGMAEFQSGDTVSTSFGGTGLSSIGSSLQILRVNAAGNALEFSTLEDLGDIGSIGSTLTAPSNADFTILTAGTGNIVLNDIGINDNTITTNRSNDDLKINASGSGTVVLENLKVGTSGATVTTILDEDTMGSDSATSLATQQSIKAYVDTQDANIASDTLTLTNKTFDVEGTGNSISNIDVADFKAAAIIVESEGIGSNDNDTTLPTSAAVKNYVDTQITAEDLDFSADDSTVLSIDLDSEVLHFAGGNGISTSVSNNTVTHAIDTGTVVTLADAQTLTNKVLTSPTINAFSGTGNGSITGTLSIVTTTTDDSFLITTTEASNSAAPVITLKRNSSSPADADYIGRIKFKGENDADQEVQYGSISGKILDASDGTEDGAIELNVKKAGSNVIAARLNSDELKLLNGTTLDVDGAGTFAGSVTATSVTTNDIVSNGSNADITIDPAGTGNINLTAGADVVIPTSIGLVLDGAGAEKIESDGTDISISVGANGDINIPADIGLTFGNDGEKIEGDGTDLTITGNNIKLTATTDVIIPTNVGLHFTDANEKIESDGSKITITSGGTAFAMPTADGTDGQALITDGSGTLSFGTVGATPVSDDGAAIVITDKHITSVARTVDSFQTTFQDSVLYYVVSNDFNEDAVNIQKVSVCHNDSASFISSAGTISKASTTNMTTFSTTVDNNMVRVKATTTNAVGGSLSFYKFGLGDNTATGTSGNVIISQNTDVDSASESLVSFAHATFRGAKLFISINNNAKTEVGNTEALVVHDGTNAFISQFGGLQTGDNPLLTLTAAISGDNVVVSAAGGEANLRVTIHAIMLKDTMVSNDGTHSNSEAIAPVTISSGSTAVDELVESTANGAVYYLVSKNATEGAYAVNEVILAMGGADITVASSAFVSTKETNQLTFDADFKTDAENTGRLLCASTSGANTTVSAYRINLLAK